MFEVDNEFSALNCSGLWLWNGILVSEKLAFMEQLSTIGGSFWKSCRILRNSINLIHFQNFLNILPKQWYWIHLVVSLGSYHFLPPGGGASICWGGGPEFFGIVKGGTNFFQGVKGGDQNFRRVTEGGTRKGGPIFSSGSKGGGPEYLEGHRGGTRIFNGGTKIFCACQRGGPANTDRRPPSH